MGNWLYIMANKVHADPCKVKRLFVDESYGDLNVRSIIISALGLRATNPYAREPRSFM